jgi:ER membrane protein complex subunit 2
LLLHSRTIALLTNHVSKIHARLGELNLTAAKAAPQNEEARHLCEALKRFSRSIELCDDYLRGYYGLKSVC